jgi:hypothetical protein
MLRAVRPNATRLGLRVGVATACLAVVSLGSVGVSASVPGPPTNVAGAAGNAQVVVSWSAPVSDGGSAILSYTATASPGGQSCSWSSGPLSCTVTGLTNGTAYTFMVTATNTVGPAASSASASVTLCDDPNPAGLVPSQVGDRYDLGPLWDADHTGQGVRVALIEVGTSVDASVLAQYQQCIHTGPVRSSPTRWSRARSHRPATSRCPTRR